LRDNVESGDAACCKADITVAPDKETVLTFTVLRFSGRRVKIISAPRELRASQQGEEIRCFNNHFIVVCV
jgi:hypothetical protein